MNGSRSRLPSLDDCVHCGLCLPVCPTYAIDRRESENPRGRIAALRAVAESRTALTPALREGLDDCLVCRACESACPSGISMEHLMAGHRAATPPRGGDLAARVERVLLEELIPYPERLEQLFAWLRWIPPWLLRRGRDLPRPERLRALPLPPSPSATGVPRARVTLLRGCIADRLFRSETLAAAELLRACGYRVEFASAGCCGALHRHAGLPDRALELARARARDLLATRPDHIVVESAGCAAALLGAASGDGDGDGDAELTEVAARVTDTATLLVAIPRSEWPARPASPLPSHPRAIAFFPPCHQLHGTGNTGATRTLLSRLFESVEEFPGEHHCCGAAGFYLLRRRAPSRMIGERARRRWEEAGRPPIATGNPGCLLRWESLVGDRGDVRHPVRWARDILLGPP